MTTEELLKTRYKVIAKYPFMSYKVGDVINEEKLGYFQFNRDVWFSKEDMDTYPHLFRKLEWWEERAIEDMPEYVKIEDKIIKVKKWVDSDTLWLNLTYPEPSFTMGNKFYPPVYPSSLEEYNQYNNQ